MSVFCPQCGSTLSDVIVTRSKLGVIVRKRKCFNEHTFITEERVADPDVWKGVEREQSRKRRERESHASR